MSELRQSLEVMGVAQYLFAASFLGCYALAIGGFFGPRSRGPVALAALMSAVGFSLQTPNWVHGFLLTALAVISVGLFLASAWILQKLLISFSNYEVDQEAADTTPSNGFTRKSPSPHPLLTGSSAAQS